MMPRSSDKLRLELVARGKAKDSSNAGILHLLQVSSKNFVTNDVLEKEVVGPSTLTISAGGENDIIDITESLQGHLTPTIYGTEEDLENYSDLISVLQRKVRRLIFHGSPPGESTFWRGGFMK